VCSCAARRGGVAHPLRFLQRVGISKEGSSPGQPKLGELFEPRAGNRTPLLSLHAGRWQSLHAFANLTQVRFEVYFSRLFQIFLLETRDLLDDCFVHVVLICHAAIVIGSYRKEDLPREAIRGDRPGPAGVSSVPSIHDIPILRRNFDERASAPRGHILTRNFHF
jgi:hypothetical protein